jgi:poly(hydroxyalkanoate) depolymerase family esterase
MTSLGETLAGLAQRARAAGGTSATGRLAAVESFGPNPGGLAMLSYVPEGLASGAPLVVVLHGCGQGAEGHAAAAGWLTLADRLGFAVLAPEQSSSNNPNRCFNWFEPRDVTRGEGEAASIRAMIAHALVTYDLDPTRVFVTGLSAGGAMAAVMLATYPELFAGGAVVAGLPYGVAGSLTEALSAMRGGGGPPSAELARRLIEAAPAATPPPRLCIWHGARDHVVAPSASDDLARQWAAALGLEPAPQTVDRLPGRTRSRWLSPQGQVLIESHRLDAMGHGTPLALGDEDAIGFTAPFMLEAGVSSTWTTARFWGLAPEVADLSPTAATVGGEGGAEVEPHAAPTAGLGEAVLAATAAHVDSNVQEVIRGALRAAKLLR